MGWASGYFPLLIITSGGGFTGLFVYSPGPGLGNLIASVPAAAGTDPYGNAYMQGMTSYTPNGLGGYFAINMNGQTLTFTGNGNGFGNPYTTINGTIAMDAAFTSLVLTAAQNIKLVAINGFSNLGLAFLPNQTAIGSNPGGVTVAAKSSDNRVHLVNAVGSDYTVSGAAPALIGTTTITQASFQNLASATIIAADANAGDVWKFTIYGYGTWGSTQQALTVQARFGATIATVVGTAAVIDATALAVSAAFQYKLELILACVTAGAGATWRISVSGTVAETANNLIPGTPANNSVPFATGTGSSDVTLDSTVNEVVGVSVMWASTTGAPTITKTIAYLEKLTM